MAETSDEWVASNQDLRRERAETREVLGAQIFESVVDAARRVVADLEKCRVELREEDRCRKFERDAMDAVYAALGGDATDVYGVPDDVVALAKSRCVRERFQIGDASPLSIGDLVDYVGDAKRWQSHRGGWVRNLDGEDALVQWQAQGGEEHQTRWHKRAVLRHSVPVQCWKPREIHVTPPSDDVLAALRDLLEIFARDDAAFRSPIDQETLRNARAVLARRGSAP